MNLEDLRAAQTRERATDGLQDLRESFYADVADYLQQLKDRREEAAAAADDPFGDPEVQELTDKIETAEQVAEAIYERRMGKLVKQASLAAAGMPDDEEGLTAEERDLYGDLVERIQENKSHVLDVISGDVEGGNEHVSPEGEVRAGRDEPSPDPDPSTGDVPERPTGEASAAEAMGGSLADEDADGADRSDDADSAGDAAESDDAPEDDGSADADTERTTVRVTRDVGEILGVDERPYDLEAEDVVSLPEANAKPLVEKGAAEKLE